MPRKKKNELSKENIDKQEQQEHKSVSEVDEQQRTDTGLVSKANVATSEINRDEVKHIHNAITFPCPVCSTCLQMSNQIEINRKKGCNCRCVPLSFKVSSKTKTINIEKKENGDLELDTNDHEMKLSWCREITPEDEKHAQEVSKIVKEVMRKWPKE